jgi:outer membrane protein assembly factor BamB
VQAAPKVVNGIVYIGSRDKNFYALDAAKGSVIWTYPTEGPVSATAAVANGVVYVGSFDHNVYALDAETGAKIWSFPTGSFVESTPTLADGVVYFGSFDNKTYAVNAATGQQIWSVETGHDLCVQSSPAVVNGVVYVGSSRAGTLHGAVLAYDAADGSVIWKHETDGQVFGSPIVVGNVVYAGSSYMGPIPTEFTPDFYKIVLAGLRGTVYALDKTNGNLVWSYQTGGAMYSSPAVVDGVLYVGSMDRTVYAFGSVAQSGLGELLIYIIVGVAVAMVVAAIVVLVLGRQKGKS